MEYLSVEQTARKWGVTLRRVQDLCKSGAIENAVRFGRAWMIPVSAKKPLDRRAKGVKEAKSEPNLPMPRKNPLLICSDLYGEPGTSYEVLKSLENNIEAAMMFKSQLDFLMGNVEKSYEDSIDYLAIHSGFNAVVAASFNLAKCAAFKGDIELWKKAKRHLLEAPCSSDADRQSLDFWIATINSIIFDTNEFPQWFKKGVFDCLPAETYCVARVSYVKYLYICAHDLAKEKIMLKDVGGLGLMRTMPHIIEPMISQAKIEKTLLPEINLRMMAAVVYHNLGEDEAAICHVDKAIKLSLPDKLYLALAEYRTALDNLLDDRLLLIDEGALKRVKELHKQLSQGLTALHNAVLDKAVSIHLTVREREIAKLAVFGLSNAEIAARLNIEVSSVKRYVFSAMNKVGAEKRAELALFL